MESGTTYPPEGPGAPRRGLFARRPDAPYAPAPTIERVGDQLRINAPNCVDCKATDVLGPRWTPREGGSGPKYRLM